MNSCLIKCENINENLELEIYINNNKIEYKLIKFHCLLIILKMKFYLFSNYILNLSIINNI